MSTWWCGEDNGLWTSVLKVFGSRSDKSDFFFGRGLGIMLDGRRQAHSANIDMTEQA